MHMEIAPYLYLGDRFPGFHFVGDDVDNVTCKLTKVYAWFSVPLVLVEMGPGISDEFPNGRIYLGLADYDPMHTSLRLATKKQTECGVVYDIAGCRDQERLDDWLAVVTKILDWVPVFMQQPDRKVFRNRKRAAVTPDTAYDELVQYASAFISGHRMCTLESLRLDLAKMK